MGWEKSEDREDGKDRVEFGRGHQEGKIAGGGWEGDADLLYHSASHHLDQSYPILHLGLASPPSLILFL